MIETLVLLLNQLFPVQIESDSVQTESDSVLVWNEEDSDGDDVGKDGMMEKMKCSRLERKELMMRMESGMMRMESGMD